MNSLYGVDDRYVVRIGRREDALRRFESEMNLFQRIGDQMPVPKVLALGEEGRSAYQVQQFIRGERLSQAWLRLDATSKQRVLEALVRYLRVLHANRFSAFGYLHSSSKFKTWPEYWENEMTTVRRDLSTIETYLPDEIMELLTSSFVDSKGLLDDSVASLVYGDLWPGNVLVRGSEVVGLLDFESAMQAPAEYELVSLEKFCLYPNDYGTEGPRVSSCDFADFVLLFKRQYPELFQIDDLRRRLDLYQSIVALRSHIGYLKRNVKAPKRHFPINPIAKVTNFLFEDGARAF
ncbi:MAG: aminoglycoside phosphotransferase family protein [Candidatus Bathyarchaeia archaeon]